MSTWPIESRRDAANGADEQPVVTPARIDGVTRMGGKTGGSSAWPPTATAAARGFMLPAPVRRRERPPAESQAFETSGGTEQV